MKNSFTALFLFLFLSQSLFTKTNAQDDCFGLGSMVGGILSSGIHGGYGFQKFSAEGLNRYTKIYNKNIDEFGFATGFKFGINLFQVLVDEWVIGMRLSYHILKEEHSATGSVAGGIVRRDYDLTLKSFQTGFSFAYYASKHLDIKIADLTLTFNSADLETRVEQPFLPTEQEEFESVENPIGFSAGSGFTVYIIPPYLSIEGSIGYSFFSIDRMRGFPSIEIAWDTDFIDGGGLYAFAQLNIVIPFN